MRPSDRPRRPLTVEELEVLHAPNEWFGSRVPGVAPPKPWLLITMVAISGLSIGFVFALAWHVADTRLSSLGPTRAEIVTPVVREPLPNVPELDHARAVPERTLKQTTPVTLDRPAPPAPEPQVISRDPAESGSSPPGYIEAEVDSETARDFEKRHGGSSASD
jgi:hypothetical protein